jgi:hypothetical protein
MMKLQVAGMVGYLQFSGFRQEKAFRAVKMKLSTLLKIFSQNNASL